MNNVAILNITPLTLLLNLSVALALALIIVFIYKFNHSGLSYSQSFVFTLVMLAILTTGTMMIIGSNIVRAFTLLGAFTIIRFRTAIKDTRDIAFVFWALITGMAVGTNNYIIAAMLTALLSVIIVVFTKIKFGSIRNFDYILNFLVPNDLNTKLVSDVFENHFKSAKLLNIASRNDGSKLEYTYSVRLIDEKNIAIFIKDFNALPGVERINIVSAKDDIEY